jgi:hypothetical protein
MYVITYSLRENESDSDNYYKNVAAFTDEVLSEADDLLRPFIDSYHAYLCNKAIEKQFTYEESTLEMLMLGVLWRVYSGDARELDAIPQQLLSALTEKRRKNMALKPGIDFLRGILSTIFLSPDLYDNLMSIKADMNNFEQLLLWLEATGEFGQEVKRLGRWKNYLAALTEKEAIDTIASAITFALWFEKRSEECIGIYTENVDRYLNEMRPKKYWHEDVIFCGRRRVEYHLNMVGAEILNRVFRDSFLKTSKKLLLLPTCMRLLPGSKCKAQFSEKGIKCFRCSKECHVCQLTKLGEKLNFDVIMVAHESSISADKSKKPLFDADTGVIGVACVLNLISGGWMLKEMGIPAQCILLDYCGCKSHWHSEGIPTDINVNKLKQLLEIT